LGALAIQHGRPMTPTTALLGLLMLGGVYGSLAFRRWALDGGDRLAGWTALLGAGVCAVFAAAFWWGGALSEKRCKYGELLGSCRYGIPGCLCADEAMVRECGWEPNRELLTKFDEPQPWEVAKSEPAP